MIVIFLLILLHFLVWYRYNKLNNFLIGITLFALLFSLLFLILLTIELRISGIYNRDYGSDANYYWNAFLNVLNGDSWSNYLAPNYVRFGAIILLLSPNVSILWIKITNILLYTLSINLMFVLYLKRIKQDISWPFYFLSVVLSINGVIVWTVIRNLKETFFIFILVLFIFLINESYRIRRFKLLFYPLILGINYVFFKLLNGIRPLGGILSLLLFWSSYFVNEVNYSQFNPLKENIKKQFWILLITLGIIAYILSQKFYLILEFRELFTEGDSVNPGYSSSFNLLMYPVYILRFLLGPGPLRAIRQLLYGDLFQVSTFTGDVLIFLGSLMWWLVLLFVLYMFVIKLNRIKSILNLFDFVTICVIITLAYSFISGGTGDTRLRSMVYFFSIPIVIYFLVGSYEKDNYS